MHLRIFILLIFGLGVVQAAPYRSANAQSAEETALWLRSLGIKLHGKEATAEGVLDADDVDFSTVPRGRLVAADLAKLRALPRLKSVDLRKATGADAAIVELVKSVPGLRALWLQDSDVSNEAIAALAAFTELEALGVSRTGITGAGFAQIAHLRKLRSLAAIDTQFGDADIDPLLRLSDLRRLSLDGTRLTDAGLAKLASIRTLQLVYTRGSAVTDAGVRAVQAVRPDLRIH